MKKIAKAIISMGVVLAFAGCSWQIPQTVAVKTEADYSFSLGSYEQELNDEMDSGSMLGDFGSAPVVAYDYFPGKRDKNTQHFMMEIKVLECNFAEGVTIPNSGSVDLSTLINPSSLPSEKKGLEFNPTSILTGMKDNLGGDLDGKIKYAEVPMYLYCETIPGITATATMRMFYGNKANPIVEIADTTKSIFNNTQISNSPRPAYAYEDDAAEKKTVITVLAENSSIGNEPIEIKDLINIDTSKVSEDDQLCVECSISNVSGTIDASLIQGGIPFKIYAVIDLPLYFDVLEDVAMDVNKMSGGSEEAAEATETSNDAVTETKENEFSKYLNVMDAVSFKYIIYNLPLYSTKGLSLGIDLVGDGHYEKGTEISFVEKGKTITEEDKSIMTLQQTTIQRMKAASQINPNFKIFINKDSRFSIPREKKIDMNIEIGFTTNGTVQVK